MKLFLCVFAVKFNEFPSKRTNRKEYCSFATWKCRNNGRICAFSSQFSLCAFFCALNAERNTKRWIIALAIALARRRNRKTQPTHRMKTHRERPKPKYGKATHTHEKKSMVKWWVIQPSGCCHCNRNVHNGPSSTFNKRSVVFGFAKALWLCRVLLASSFYPPVSNIIHNENITRMELHAMSTNNNNNQKSRL